MDFLPTLPLNDQDQDIAFAFTCAGVNEGKLVVTSFTADERLFGLTEVTMDLTSADAEIDLQDLIDKPASLVISHKYLPEPRYLSGVIASVSRGDTGHRRTAYQVTILPALHRLSHGSDSRIFQQQSVPDIIKIVLKEQGIDDVEWRLIGEHLTREYCVAYRETHLAFIERIASEEGLWFYFQHGKNGQHTLVFTDQPGPLAACPGQEELTYNALASGAVKGVSCRSFTYREQLRSTAYTQKDYCYKQPKYGQDHAAKARELNGVPDAYRLYDYPGRYKEPKAGIPFTQAKLDAVRVDASTGEGETNTPCLVAGHAVKLTEHPREALNIKYLLLSVQHEGRQPQAAEEDAGDLSESGNGSGGALCTYRARFTVMPARLPYRPPLGVKPMVDGLQNAVVVGPPGEEIFCDEDGRVKVQFFWDRYGKSDDKSSCWIRVSQGWAGASYGNIAIPRIGNEVLVDFLEGDPDQPVITGRTFHVTNRSPYKLPDHKTKNVWRSDTHKAENKIGFNEISFEDENGREQIYVHGERDRDEKINHNHTERIDNNWVQSIGHNKAIEVTNNHDEVIGGNMTLSIGPSGIGSIVNATLNKLVSGISGVAKTLGLPGLFNPGEGNLSIAVEKNKNVMVGAVSTKSVGLGYYVNVGRTYSVNSGSTISYTCGNNWTEFVGGTKHVEVSDQLVETCGAARFQMASNGDIELKGGNINIIASGVVTVNGKKIKLN